MGGGNIVDIVDLQVRIKHVVFWFLPHSRSLTM